MQATGHNWLAVPHDKIQGWNPTFKGIIFAPPRAADVLFGMFLVQGRSTELMREILTVWFKRVAFGSEWGFLLLFLLLHPRKDLSLEKAPFAFFLIKLI